MWSAGKSTHCGGAGSVGAGALKFAASAAAIACAAHSHAHATGLQVRRLGDLSQTRSSQHQAEGLLYGW